MSARSTERPRRGLTPRADELETRASPSTAGSAYAYADTAAKHAYDRFTSELARIEFNSAATPAEYQALRDDARVLSEAVETSGAARSPSASARVLEATLLIDRAPLEGSLGDAGWAEVRGKLGADLTPLGASPALLDKTVADMKAAAASAAVDPGEAQVLTSDIAAVQSARDRLNGNWFHSSYRDPEVYYTQHLRGFFRGWAQQRVADAARLQADLTSAPGGAGGVLGRDVGLIEQLGAAIPSGALGALTDAYAAAVGGGGTAGAASDAFRSAAIAVLGPTATNGRVAAVDHLAADAPAFSAAAGSAAKAQTILSDVRVVTDDGQGSSLNPFRIVVAPGA